MARRRKSNKSGEAFSSPPPTTPTAGSSQQPRDVTPRTPTRNLPLAEFPVEADAEFLNFTPQLPPKLRPAISGYMEAVKQSKRNFSDVSDRSQESICKAKHQKVEGTLSSPSYSRIVMSQWEDRFDAARIAVQSLYDAKVQEFIVLMKAYADGDLDYTKKEFLDARASIEKAIGHLRSSLIALTTSKFEMIGEATDWSQWLQVQEISDFAYIDAIIARYKTPPKATHTLFQKRDPKVQQRFRAAVLKAYGASREGQTPKTWCVISGRWWPDYMVTVKAAHIVAYNVSECTARYLFGTTTKKDGHLLDPSNGLPMMKVYEEMFDDSSIVIVPDPDDNNGFIVRHLDEDLLTAADNDPSGIECEAPLGWALEKKKLKFNTDFRPAKRYLYFSFAINVLRRQRHQVPGWWHDRVKFSGEKVWATPDKKADKNYLRKGLLTKIARCVGQVPADSPELDHLVSDLSIDNTEDMGATGDSGNPASLGKSVESLNLRGGEIDEDVEDMHVEIIAESAHRRGSSWHDEGSDDDEGDDDQGGLAG